jgi:predicted Zn-dependent protease
VRTSLHHLVPAADAAADELAGRPVRWEVFARAGESLALRQAFDGPWQRLHVREVGVACRVAGNGLAGFAAASGSGAAAGRHAARAALANLMPAADPLPPAEMLGAAPAPAPAASAGEERLQEFADRLRRGFERARHEARLMELRLLEGRSTAVLLRGEGFAARVPAAGVVVELLVAPREGPWRVVHRAARNLAALDPEAEAETARETARRVSGGRPPRHQLADVLLAPAVAAPLVLALAEWLAEPRGAELADRSRVSSHWQLVDERAGDAGLLPLPCDGEGLPSRSIAVLEDGHRGERWATWAESLAGGGRPGGAVRASYREPPAAGPANLVVGPTPGLSVADLRACLADGFHLLLPAGPVHVDPGPGSFSIRVAGLAVAGGRQVASHPFAELRGSFLRLLRGLAATGEDAAGFSLRCAVTTPSLLFRKLEIA